MSKNYPILVKEVVASYCQFEMLDKAEKASQALEKDQEESDQSRLINFYISVARTDSASEALSLSIKLIDSGIKDERLYEIALQKAVECGDTNRIEPIYSNAVSLWPARKTHFEEIRAKAR